MIETKIDGTIDDYSRQMQSQGMSLDDYMKYTGTDMAKLREDLKEQCTKELKTSLILEAIAEKENIQVSDEVFDAEIKDMADRYQMKPEDIKERLGEEGKENIKANLRIRETIKMLVNETKYE